MEHTCVVHKCMYFCSLVYPLKQQRTSSHCHDLHAQNALDEPTNVRDVPHAQLDASGSLFRPQSTFLQQWLGFAAVLNQYYYTINRYTRM